MENFPDAAGLLGLGTVFVLLFITLGPIKVLGPFMQATRNIDEAEMKRIAMRAFVISVIAGGFVGQILVENWHISVAALTLAGGIIFLLVGLSLVLEQYQPVHATPAPLPAEPMAAALRVAFPIVVTPYGIAAVIALLVNSPDAARTVSILAIVIVVMVLNLLTMLYARRIMGGVTILALQVALAVQMILRGSQDLEVF